MVNIIEKPWDNPRLQRVEKVVNLEKYVSLHAGQTSRNRGEFRFLASGSCTTVLPPSKKTENAKQRQGFDILTAVFLLDPSVRTGRRGHRPLQKKMLCCTHLFWRGSPDFIDSLKPWVIPQLFYQYPRFSLTRITLILSLWRCLDDTT